MTMGDKTDMDEQDVRVAALRSYDVLDTPPEPDIDDSSAASDRTG